MLKSKSKYILLVTLITSTILFQLPVKAQEFNKQTNDTNKSWSIKFNQDIELNDEVKSNIKLVDSKGSNVDASIRLGDSKTIIIDAPKEGYKNGEKYTLSLGDKFHSKKNKTLQGNTNFNFTVDTSASTEYKSKAEVEEALKLGVSKILSDGITGSDWQALVVARYGQQVPEAYLSDLESKIKAENGIMSQPTDYERTTLALMAIGKDPTNFDGYNFIEKIYNNTDMDNQGINAYIFALIALDSGKFDIPDGSVLTRDKIIKTVLDERTSDKGWSYGGKTADPDMTAMGLISLAPYKDRPEVKEAIDAAVDRLSAIQNDDGGYSSWHTANSESSSQVIIGLCANGIDPTSEKFTKNGKNPIDAILSYQVDGGGFQHTKGTGYNGMGTEQALEAIEAYKMFKEGKGSLYVFK